MRFLEFFAANIRNPHTRRAYARAADEFLTWCAAAGVPSIAAVQPVHVATWIEAPARASSPRRASSNGSPRSATYSTGSSPPGRAGQPGRVGARAPARRHLRTNAGARSIGSARAARQHRCHDTCRSARSRADRADGLQLRPDRCGARDVCRGCFYAKPAALGAVAREGRQAPCDAMPSQP
jgi:hypothetical protein